jgi:hypothetical protein
MKLGDPGDIRELILYARPGEGPVSGDELERRRYSTRQHNPQRFEEFRSASKTVGSWEELRRSGARTPMNLAELHARMRALEERLQLEPER